MERSLAKDVIRWLRTHDHVITRAEARQLGVHDGQVEYLLRTGRWQSVQKGVYRDTTTPRTKHQDAVAAISAAGAPAVASHATAAWLWDLIERPPDTVHLSVPERTSPVLRGVSVHRSRDLDPARTIWHKGVACTDPLRTLADLGACVDREMLTRAVDQALARRLVTVAGLRAELDRIGKRGRRGPAALRAVLLERGFVGGPAPSVLESRALRLFRGAAIPIDKAEQRAGPEGEYWIDFTVEPWEGGAMVAVETHGYVWHFSPEHLRRDLARQRRLTLGGWRYLAYTWRDIAADPDAVAAEVRAAIVLRHGTERAAN